LLRWRHAEKGMIPPADFIPLAEEAGLIVPLGRWALETACAQLALWRDRPGLAGVTLAVNVSPRQLLDANVVPLVRDLLAASGADPRRLRLEITESCVMENIDDAIFKLAALKALGVGVSLDDFGTGYSCLAHLTRLPLDELKIDRRFVEYALVDAKVASIVRTIITLARHLNLAVIAEGVETADQRAFLEAEGCSLHQGYLFSPALTPPAFEAFALQHAGPDMPAKAS
jgi:EAL domain-containing protein (putative c-di-GMP-specific phosphodiesterase class I)